LRENRAEFTAELRDLGKKAAARLAGIDLLAPKRNFRRRLHRETKSGGARDAQRA
jgi:hypothetical protein